MDTRTLEDLRTLITDPRRGSTSVVEWEAEREHGDPRRLWFPDYEEVE